MNQVNLSRLSHDVVQNTYKELHALLDSLGDVEPEEKREKLLSFLLQIHHRFARLLVAVRWYFSYSAFHNSAQVTKDLATRRSTVPTFDADTLWMVSNISRGAAAQVSALVEAAEVLGASSVYNRIPRVIETSIQADVRKIAQQLDSDSDSSDNDFQEEVEERLRVTTRLAVSQALPEGVKIIRFGAPPKSTAIRIGVKRAWTADILLDRLQIDRAYLLLLRFSLHVDTDPDAISPLRSKYQNRERGLILPREQMEPLRQMLEDRMRWTAMEADENGKWEIRMKNILITLSKALSNECCAKVSMDHVRAQASALLSQKSWRGLGIGLTGVGSQADDSIPVTINLWPYSYLRGSISISCRESDAELDPHGRILQIQTSPEEWNREEGFDIDIGNINIETLILQIGRNRAFKELESVREICCKFLPSTVTTHVLQSTPALVTLMVKVNATPILGFGISLRTGAMCTRSYRSVPLAASSVDLATAKELKDAIWTGDRFFADTSSMRSAVKKAINKTLTALRIHIAVFNANLGGHGAMASWPPGPALLEIPKYEKAGIHILPPFTPLERKRPRTFLTVNYANNRHISRNEQEFIETNKRRRMPKIIHSRTSDGCAFIDGRKTISQPSPTLDQSLTVTASNIAECTESRHRVTLTVQMTRLLRELENLKLATPIDEMSLLQSPNNVGITLKTRPIDYTNARISLSEDGRWAVHLTVTNESFDDNNLKGFTISYSASNRLLTFSYPSLSQMSITCFSHDLSKARVAAALAMGLSENSRHYKILRRLPTHVEVQAYGLRFCCGIAKTKIFVCSVPQQQILSQELLPLVEEVLSAAGQDMTTALPGLLETAIPMAMAIEVSVPKDRNSYKVKFISPLVCRITVASRSRQVQYAIDVDLQRGRGIAIVSDVARIFNMKASDRNLVHRNQYKTIPVWEPIVSNLISKRSAQAVFNGAGVAMEMRVFMKLLPNLIKKLER